MNPLRIGLVGMGTVGRGVWHHLQTQSDLLASRCGRNLEIRQIAVRNPSKAADLALPKERLTTRWQDLITNPDLDVIVELIGGTTEALDLIRAALRAGKHVVTANKALLAAHGAELFRLAAEQQRRLLYEASVGGGIPLLQSLTRGLVANQITSLYGILNGTCNYILTRMTDEGLDYAAALAEAKHLGYAEADERLDVDGFDTADKTVVLAALAHGFWPRRDAIAIRGIAQIDHQDIAFAKQLGYTMKLIGMFKLLAPDQIEIEIQPMLIPASHVFASVKGGFNAVLVRGDVVGETLFYGRGAGADATASAVLSDLATLAYESPKAEIHDAWHRNNPIRLVGTEHITAHHYLRLRVDDQPGTLAQVAAILGNRQISISSIIQPKSGDGQTAQIILLLHHANVAELNEAKLELERLPAAKEKPVSYRIEDFA